MRLRAEVSFLVECAKREHDNILYLDLYSYFYRQFLKVPMKQKSKVLKKTSLFEGPFKTKKNGVFLFLIYFVLPEIFKFFLLCKLDIDDVTSCEV